MVLMVKDSQLKSQNGYCVDPFSGYTLTDNDVAFAAGQTILCRFATLITKGSTINSATLTVNLVAKDQTVTQSSIHTVRGEATGDSKKLTVGALEVGIRAITSASVSWTPVWTGVPSGTDPGLVMYDIDIKTILQEIVARSDFETGSYVTIMITCTNESGSDMSMRLSNGLNPRPKLTVDYTPPASDVFYTINRCENSEFSTVVDSMEDASALSSVPLWTQNSFFSSWVDPVTSGGTVVKDTSFTRVSGLPTLRFTCGTPDADVNKRTGPTYGAVSWFRNVPFIFCGWIYAPSSIPTTSDFFIGDPFFALESGTSILFNQRNVWVPFCSLPLVQSATDATTRWPAVGLNKFTAGQQFWISEPTFLESPFRQMPFNGRTPVKPYIEHLGTASRQQSIRRVSPRTTMLIAGVPKRVPNWTRREPQPIFEASEPVKGGPQIQQLDSSMTVGGIPAGVTVTEL